jgi:tripartite ATP-independent transporter DctM subunit
MEMVVFVAGAVALMLIGMPISFALGLASIVYMVWSGVPPVSFVQHLSKGVNSYTLLALPFFILAGQLMNHGGITAKIIRFTNALTGHIRGGLAHANVVAAMIFAGISGSAVAEAGALGTVQLKAMKENGYEQSFSVGLIAGSMTIGPIIPPSIIMVVYGIAASVPIGSLFIGGIVPGILMGLGMMLTVVVAAHWRSLPRHRAAFSLKELLDSFLDAFLALLAPLLVIGGILTGAYTATEAGAIVAVYAFVVGMFYYRELTLRLVFTALIETMLMSSTILLIMGMSNSFAWVLAFEQAPAHVAEFLLGISHDPTVITLLLMGLYLILGCFMEAVAIVVMTIPIVLPVMREVGIDPVHFGVILAVNLSLGTITPPLGIVMYVLCDLAGITVNQFTRYVAPFFIMLLVILILITLIPATVTFLPRYFGT